MSEINDDDITLLTLKRGMKLILGRPIIIRTPTSRSSTLSNREPSQPCTSVRQPGHQRCWTSTNNKQRSYWKSDRTSTAQIYEKLHVKWLGMTLKVTQGHQRWPVVYPA